MDSSKPDFSERTKSYRTSYVRNIGALYGNGDPDVVVIKPKRKKRRHIERDIQIQVVAWLHAKRLAFTAIPNEGKRSVVLGSLMRRMGLVAGVSDLFIAEPTKKYSGFWLEFKQHGNKPTELQQNWLDLMIRKGYHASWTDSFDDAVRQIETYMVS